MLLLFSPFFDSFQPKTIAAICTALQIATVLFWMFDTQLCVYLECASVCIRASFIFLFSIVTLMILFPFNCRPNQIKVIVFRNEKLFLSDSQLKNKRTHTRTATQSITIDIECKNFVKIIWLSNKSNGFYMFLFLFQFKKKHQPIWCMS